MITIKLKSERSEKLMESLKMRTDADTAEEVVRRALHVYNIVGMSIENGRHLDPIDLIEFHRLAPELSRTAAEEQKEVVRKKVVPMTNEEPPPRDWTAIPADPKNKPTLGGDMLDSDVSERE